MARASTRTLLSLDRFFQLVGYHPLHGNQVEVADIAPAGTCSDPLLQFSWQEADKTGREEVADMINQVEFQLQTLLGYPVGPTWIEDERQSLPKLKPNSYNYSLNSYGMQQSVRANNGKVISGGIEAQAIIALGQTITYSDVDSDGYKETATVTVPTTVLKEEITIYYPGEEGSYEWQIRPISVVTAAGVATITFRREQLVLPEFLNSLNARAVNGLDDTKFLTEVDVYRHYNNPAQQATLMWESGVCGCLEVGCTSCAFEVQTGCVKVRDPRLGIVAVSQANWNAESEEFDFIDCEFRQADQVRLWYRAGDDLRVWERTIAYLVLAWLDRPLCSCSAFKAQAHHWREDLAQNLPNTSFQVSRKLLDNPLGTTRAAMRAWPLVQRLRVNQ